MKCVGYVGLETFDVILYITRTLTKLNKRVLIIDLSKSGNMERVIYHGMNLDSSKNIVNYRDINYVRYIPSNEEMSSFEGGVIFMVFGQNYNEDTLKLSYNFDFLNIVVNTFPNFITNINTLLKDINNNNIHLLIRDIINIDDIERVKAGLDLKVEPTNIDHLYYSIEDYESAINCQVSQVVRFTNISSDMKRHIVSAIKGLYPDIKEKPIRKAVAMAKKGV